MPADGAAIPWFDAAAVAWALNVGGESYTDIEGISFAADPRRAEGGRIDQVIGVQDAAVFQSYRAGALTFAAALPAGSYDITFYFAEPEDLSAGQRVFDVLAEGEVVIAGLDVLVAGNGAQGSALTRTVTAVAVTDGELSLALAATRGEPVISGIVVRERRLDERAWTLVWQDEFDYQGAPDPDKWSFELWDARRVNDEDQAYTDRARNVRVADGRLTIEAHRESHGTAEYTSGRIHSRGKGDWLYGRIDLRARLPGGQGSWPALWMLPSDAFRYATDCPWPADDWQGRPDCDAWPNSGEIDIMEHVGYDMPRLHGTVHNLTGFGGNGHHRKGSVEIRHGGLEQDFHVYSLEWTPSYLRVYFEGSPYFTYVNDGSGWQSWPYDHPYHLIMNLAIGGHWGRAGGPIDDSVFPLRFEVDYVRVFQ